MKLREMTTDQLIAHGEELVLDAFAAPALTPDGNGCVVKWVKYADGSRRAAPRYVSLRKLVKSVGIKPEKDPRSVSVKFDGDRNITEGTGIRLALLQRYADNVALGDETPIDYVVNEDKVYRNQMALMEVLPEEWFDDDDEIDLS